MNRIKPGIRMWIAIALLAGLMGPGRAWGQLVVPPVGEAEQNKKLRIQLDRGAIRAFEPVYLCLTAEQYASPNDAEVQIRHDDGPWQVIAIPKKEWTRSPVSGSGKFPLQRRSVLLQASENNGLRTWFFNQAGNYRIRVKMGPDSTNLDLKVAPADPGEEESWISLGDRITDILENNFADPPEQATIDACVRVIRKYPKTLCAAYCQSYISITKFKILFEKNHQTGGKEVYGNSAAELQKIANAFRDSFFGEMTGFYAAYAKGLSGEFESTLAIADGMKTHVTPWSDGVIDMRTEVLAHLAPQVVPFDPSKPAPTTGPTPPAAAVDPGAFPAIPKP